MKPKIGFVLLTVAFAIACGSSTTRIRTPLEGDDAMNQALVKGAKDVGCDPGTPDPMIGLIIDCPEGRIVFGHDSGENMREEKEGEPYPIEVLCFDGLADKCQQTIDKIVAAGKK